MSSQAGHSVCFTLSLISRLGLTNSQAWLPKNSCLWARNYGFWTPLTEALESELEVGFLGRVRDSSGKDRRAWEALTFWFVAEWPTLSNLAGTDVKLGKSANCGNCAKSPAPYFFAFCLQFIAIRPGLYDIFMTVASGATLCLGQAVFSSFFSAFADSLDFWRLVLGFYYDGLAST